VTRNEKMTEKSQDHPKKGNPPGAKPAPNPIKRRMAAKKAIASEIVTELNSLRGEAEEVIGRFQLRLASRINDLIRLYEEKEIAGEKRHLPSAKVELQVLKQLRAIRVKPQKGRIKDLVRLHQLFEELTAFHEESDGRKMKGER
jgi:hypothetical protein